jgi:cold shock CspA family protein
MTNRRKLIRGLLAFATATIIPSFPAKARSSQESEVIRISGRVKWFDTMRGYGFIVPDNGMPDIVLHLSCLKRCGLDAPTAGTGVMCDVVLREKGYRCLRILSLETQA